jgi:cytochrome c
MEGERAVYAEPLPFPHRRLRDIISMSDGRIVVLTDLGELLLLRNAERHASEPREFVVTGFASLSAPLPEERPSPELPPVERGQRVFAVACARCHSLTGDVGIGPPLNGVVGRPIGAVAGFAYSRALRRSGKVWSEARLRSFLTHPETDFHGSTMPGPLITWEDVPNVIAYLRTSRGDPALMEAEAVRARR